MSQIVSLVEVGDRSASVDIDGVRTYERQFKVVTDSPTTDPLWILDELATTQTLFLYKYYQTSTEADIQALVSSITIRQDPADTYGLVWNLSVPYGPVSPYSHSYNPLLVFPSVTFEGVNDQRICYQDYQGNYITNSAGDSFDPPPMIFSAGCVIRIRQNLHSFSPATIFFYTNCINSDTDPKWFGLEPHTCRIDPPRGSIAFSQSVGSYWETEWTIICKPNVIIDPASGDQIIAGWDEYIPSRGYRQLVGGNWTKIYNFDGSEIEQAALLDSSGVALTPPVASSDVFTMTYQIYQEISFADTFRFATTGIGSLFF